MEWLIGIICIGVLWLVYVVVGLFKRIDDKHDQELEEWEGVTDVKRETRDKLASDPDYVKRVQKHFND